MENTTLGNSCVGKFYVKRGNKIISAHANKSYKLWKLFKYLLTKNRDKNILPEVAMDTLWPENNYSDPKKALRTAVYRLRKLLNEIVTMLKAVIL